MKLIYTIIFAIFVFFNNISNANFIDNVRSKYGKSEQSYSITIKPNSNKEDKEERAPKTNIKDVKKKQKQNY